MISKLAGMLSKSDTKTRTWWAKLAVAIVVSNVLFFLLFSSSGETKTPPSKPVGAVELRLTAELLTSFEVGKRVLLIQRHRGLKVEGRLLAEASEQGKIIVEVREEDAGSLLHQDSWEVLPYLRHLTLTRPFVGAQHEIRY